MRLPDNSTTHSASDDAQSTSRPNISAVYLGCRVGDDHPVVLDFARDGHALILGGTGRGKTTLVTSILDQWVATGGTAVVADPVGVAFRAFQHTPGVAFSNGNPHNTEIVLGMAHDEMDARYALLREAGVTDFYALSTAVRAPRPLLVILDVASDVLALEPVRGDPTIAAQNEVVARSREHVDAIAQRGQTVGVHLLLTTQRADAQRAGDYDEDRGDYSLPHTITDNVAMRVLLGPSDAVSRALAGFPQTASAATRGVDGRGLYGRVHTVPVEVQFADLPTGAAVIIAAGVPVDRAILYADAGVGVREALDLQARHEAGEDTDTWLSTLAALRAIG